jgi:Na+/proline symporter
VNLLTAPLFGLFFLAMFVPWATSFGTLVGAAVGLAVVVAINYWEPIFGTKGISFLWAMPLGLAAQVAAGSIASLLPVGVRSPEK